MPKPRAKLTPLQEEIINRGGEPGSGSIAPAVAEPATKATKAAAPAAPAPAKRGVYRPTMVRFTPEEYAEVESAFDRYNKKAVRKVSMNNYLVTAIITACREQD